METVSYNFGVRTMSTDLGMGGGIELMLLYSILGLELLATASQGLNTKNE